MVSGCDLTKEFPTDKKIQIRTISGIAWTPPTQTETEISTSTSSESNTLEIAKPFLPHNGILLIGGGLTSGAVRFSVDFDQKTLTYSNNNTENSSPYDPALTTKTLKLTDDQLRKITDLAFEIWQSRDDFTNKTPQADYNLTVIINKNDSSKLIDSHGPPVDQIANLDAMIRALLPEEYSSEYERHIVK